MAKYMKLRNESLCSTASLDTFPWHQRALYQRALCQVDLYQRALYQGMASAMPLAGANRVGFPECVRTGSVLECISRRDERVPHSICPVVGQIEWDTTTATIERSGRKASGNPTRFTQNASRMGHPLSFCSLFFTEFSHTLFSPCHIWICNSGYLEENFRLNTVNGRVAARFVTETVAGAKARFTFATYAARLKSCPDTNQVPQGAVSSQRAVRIRGAIFSKEPVPSTYAISISNAMDRRASDQEALYQGMALAPLIVGSSAQAISKKTGMDHNHEPQV
jgi:hypothetical protein